MTKLQKKQFNENVKTIRDENVLKPFVLQRLTTICIQNI